MSLPENVQVGRRVAWKAKHRTVALQGYIADVNDEGTKFAVKWDTWPRVEYGFGAHDLTPRGPVHVVPDPIDTLIDELEDKS